MRTDFTGENAEELNVLLTAIHGDKYISDYYNSIEQRNVKNYLDNIKFLGYEIKKKDQWISVKDRLPETDGYKIVVIQWENSDPAVDTARYFVKEKTFSSVVNSLITHWQPLPETPKK